MRIGIIGAGAMGRTHAAALSTIGGVSVAAIGTAGVAHVDAFAQYVELFSNRRARGERYAWGDDPDRLMLADWLRALGAGGRAPIGAAECLRALEIVFAAYRSAELHAPVEIAP